MPVEAHAQSLAAGRAAARAAFPLNLRQAVTHLEDLLAVDDLRRAPATAELVAASHGAEAGRFLSASQLLDVLGGAGAKGSVMDAARRGRCEAAHATLARALANEERAPAFRIFQASEEIGDPCAAALAYFDRQLSDMAPILRAMRVAKLEAISGYDAAVHDELLRHVEPTCAGMAPVVVVEPVERLAEFTLTSFSRLLRSARPVQILVPVAGEAGIDVGAIALAHAGVFVLQTSSSRPDHLAKGLAEMARTARTAVAVVFEEPAALYRYDPDIEGGYADRFALEKDSPAPEMLTALAAKPVAVAPEESAQQAYERVLALLANPESVR